ncbi:Uncharacterised protein [Staphylococcus aureus]|nr:Uncharacterised protein [Staphylococcus aureus]
MPLITDTAISKPTRSDSAYVPVLGRPIACPVKASTSTMLNLCCSARYIISFIVCVPTLFATKPGTSLTTMTPLPNTFCAKFFTSNMIDSFVCDVGINSTNFIIRGGLKKCRPKNRS